MPFSVFPRVLYPPYMTASASPSGQSTASPGSGFLGTVLAVLFGWPAATWLTPLMRPYLGALGFLFALAVVSALAALVPPYLTKLVIDEGLMARDAEKLIQWSAAFFVFGLAAMGLGAANSILHMRFSVRMLADIRSAVLDNILAQSPRWHAGRRIGETLSRFDADAGEVQQFAFNALLSGTGNVLRLIGGAAMLFVLEWRLAVIALLLAPLEFLFFSWARPKTQERAREVRAARGTLASRVAETVAGLPVLQAFRGEDQARAAFHGEQGRLIDALQRSQVWGEATRAVPTVLTALVRAAVFILGGLWVIAGDWPLGSLIAFSAYLGFLIGPMQALIGLWHAQARMTASLERLMALAIAPADIVDPALPVPLPDGPGELRLEVVSAMVPGRERPLFHDLDVTFPAGARIHLTGRSGVGKSTLIALFQRHLDPSEGRVTLDGADLRTLALAELRSAIAVVPQAGFVFHGTVAENLRIGSPDASDDALWEALRAVELADAVESRGGLLAPIGERGLDLSGGQRQRLSLARAWLRPFRVLVLDESLSEVDTTTAARIVANFDVRFVDRTRIIVTHGPVDGYGGFDRIVDLDVLAGVTN
ncbi:MAG: ABC transporter ATP-binding protein [Hyphomicrobiales bacterium]|nr:MAG: ABC transporter ATP-binding protein [Hyphomicrobiales bacterium]